MRVLVVNELKVDVITDRRPVRVLRGVSLHLDKDMSLGLVGESGSGKTMTALSIVKMLPPVARIAGGSVVIDGVDLTQLPEAKMAQLRGEKVAMIFQNAASALNPLYSAGQQIADAYRAHFNVNMKEAWRKAIEVLEATGIPNPAEKARNYPHELSGGMCQRVMIGMALVCSPEILIADEPTTGLDLTIQAQVLELIRTLAEQHHMSLLFISHDLAVVSELCDHVAVMYAGRIVESGTTKQVMENAHNPYTIGLMKCFQLQSGRRMPFIRGRALDLTTPERGCSFAPRCEHARGLCFEEIPELREVEDGHEVRCHFPQ